MTDNVIPVINDVQFDPGWGDLFGAAFRRENVVGSIYQRLKNSRTFGDSDPTPVNDADINTAVTEAGLTPFIGHFTDVQTRGDLNNKLTHIRQQAEDRNTLDRGGWAGFGAQLTAGVFDAPTLVPFGHTVRLGRLGSETLNTTASKLAITAMLDAGVTEAGLQLTQDLRSTEESALAIGGSVLLTTTLGTGLARILSKRHQADLAARMETELPKIADGRAEAEVANQFEQASANTARAMRGGRLEPMEPPRDFKPGSVARSFLEENGVTARNKLDDIPDGTQRAALIDADGKLYDLGDKYRTHAAWMKAVDDAGNDLLSSDMANILQLSVFKNNGVVQITTGSQSPLLSRQLRGIRAAAKSYGIDARDLYFREARNGDVEVMSLDANMRANPAYAGFENLSQYKSAGARVREADVAGKPPEDPELRQGLPNTRWDGKAEDAPWKRLAPPAPGYVRFYHGGPNANGIDGPRWVTPDPVYARDYRGQGSKLYYVDIPENSPLLSKTFDDTGTDVKAPYAAFELPEDMARAGMRLVDDAAGQPPSPPVVGAYAEKPSELVPPGGGKGLPNTRWDGKAETDLNPVPPEFRGKAPKGGAADDTAAWFLDGDKLVYANARRSSLDKLFGDSAYASRFDAYPRVEGKDAGGSQFTIWYKDTPEGKEAAEKLRAFYETADRADLRAYISEQGLLLGYDPAKVAGYVDQRFGGQPPVVGAYAEKPSELVPPGGGKGGGNGGGKGPGGGNPRTLEGPDPLEPLMTPSQMAFAQSGNVIGVTRGLSRFMGGSPILEMMNSSATSARAWIMRVAELSGRTKGAYEGVANPIAIQSRMSEYDGMRAKMTREFNDAYKQWRSGLDISGRDYENFSRRVSQTLVRNDYDNVEEPVAKAAKAIREVIASMYERAVEQGLIRKDAWQPGNNTKNPFVDFNAARGSATDAEFDPKDSVDYFLKIISDREAKGLKRGQADKKSKGAKNKIQNEDANASMLTREDAELFAQIERDATSGNAIALPSTEAKAFYKETGQRLVRSGTTGERGLDYNVALNFRRGPNGELGDDLIQTGGLINRRYTERVFHEREEFVRAEAMAELQDGDAVIREARAWNAEQIRKAREDAIAKGENPDEAEKSVKLNPNGQPSLFHELNRPAKQAKIVKAMNHAIGSWEFIAHGTIKGGDARTLAIEGQNIRSPLHRRNVKLSDQVLLAKGWIDDDALGIANHTVRQIAADVELARVFRRPMDDISIAYLDGKDAKIARVKERDDAEFRRPTAYWIDGADPTTVPDLGMSVPRHVIGKEYDDMIAALGSGPENDAARNALKTERALILGGTDANGRELPGLIDTVTEMIRGTHKISENSTASALNLAAARSYVFAARMGANVFTSMGDVGAVILRHGAGNLLSHYANRAASLVKSLADPENLANIARNWEMPQDRAGAILSREARAAGIAVETDLMARMASQMDLFDPFRNAKAKDTAFQQTADWLARAGSKAYFINVWTNGIRRAAYGIYVDRVIRAAMEPDKISKHERVYLDDLGITDTMLKGIRREAENGGAVLDGGVWHINADAWSDLRLRSDFWAAARKDANNANVSPTQLEKPLAFTNPIVATMLQFWSFSFGATMRIMGQSAQRVINGTDGFASDGTRTLLGIAAMVGLGMSSFALHNYGSTWRQRQTGTLDPKDELPDFNENWRQWMLQGVSRSGVFGVFSQMGDVVDNLGVNPLYKAIRSGDEDPDATDPIKRFGRPNVAKNLTGPTIGLVEDLAHAGRTLVFDPAMREKEPSRAGVRSITRNLPFVNAFYLKGLTREFTENAADYFDLPPDKR